MGNLRPALYIALGLLGYMLWVQWQRDYGVPAPTATAAPSSSNERPQAVPPAVTPPGDTDLPQPQTLDQAPMGATATTPPAAAQAAAPEAESPMIRVSTDVLDIGISLVGGTVVSAELLHYPEQLEEPAKKVNLLSPSGDTFFVAQSGLLSREAAPNHTSPYRSQQKDFHLGENQTELRVPLTWQSEQGVRVTKTFVFKRGQYVIDVLYQLHNDSAGNWSGSRYDQLQRAASSEKKRSGFTNPSAYSFNGMGFYNPQDKFEKVNFKDVGEDPYEKTAAGGWMAMIQHYFVAAWIPPAADQATYSALEIASTGGLPRFIAREVSPVQTAAPGQGIEFSSRLYVGPKLQEHLEEVAPGLEHTVNYGIFTVFSKPLFWLLSHIHALVGNWGWAIVLLTVLVKAAIFKLTETQYRSMARMRKLQPRIEQLKERFGDDRARMSQAMMELYKTEKANPLAGCLPMVVQIPVFIALYWVLLESVELRQAPFILWINNLSARDPYFVLPLFNAAFMIATQRLTPTAGMDPLQRKMMNLMPVAFAVMFAFFPAGLVLYWATNAGLSLAQQVYITRKIAATEK
jgi:YidC/Oxa1 family membrane protein insertase